MGWLRVQSNAAAVAAAAAVSNVVDTNLGMDMAAVELLVGVSVRVVEKLDVEVVAIEVR